MQTFIDTTNQQVWAFEDDVVVSQTSGGAYAFTAAEGFTLAVPATLKPYTVPEPTEAELAAKALLQSAMAAMAAGLTIASTATQAIDATYAVDQVSQMDIIAIETSLNAGKGFPGGATTFNYPDTSGMMHTFSESNFTDFAAAVRDYVYALKSVIAGSSSALPTASTTIA
ncbi:hypothetical protein HHL24_17135 [Paraburkholderia sp. RP-4-7]|uniref:Uncharacterized protein n=1 Tax=Paraburkholderia polaris TaxID=2728848 RepID=A0A848IIY9_9BURK|nr:hypothetical protein [Paraburkholderia polaris]NML99653.1 hypothetical protein [Paraburkholderia polaris]